VIADIYFMDFNLFTFLSFTTAIFKDGGRPCKTPICQQLCHIDQLYLWR